jgi:hypothetical protein
LDVIKIDGAFVIARTSDNVYYVKLLWDWLRLKSRLKETVASARKVRRKVRAPRRRPEKTGAEKSLDTARL